MAVLQVRFFGTGQIQTITGEIIPVRNRKQLALLAYLLIERHYEHSRDALMALFWREHNTDKARNNLRVALSQLRKLTTTKESDSQLILATKLDVQINPDVDFWLDVAKFEEQLQQTRTHTHILVQKSRSECADCQPHLEEAVALYQSEFLAGLSLNDCPEFEEWLFLQRERQHLLTLDAYADLATFAESAGDIDGDFDQAAHFARRQIELDPLREIAYRQQMRIFAKQGEQSLALATFERCRTILSQELGVEPAPRTQALHEQISTHQIGKKYEDGNANRLLDVGNAGSEPSLIPPKHNLPQRLTPFIGREEELEELQARLADPLYRLITVVGPGGIGKSRLALQAAARQSNVYADGIFFVPLAQIQSSQSIPEAIAKSLGLTFHDIDNSPDQALVEMIGTKHLLLILDNFEHLMDGVEQLMALLQHAPNITLLMTSRERLNVQAEDLFTLHGLSVPVDKEDPAASSSTAVRLFVDRAHRLDKQFKLTPEQLPHVIEICQILDGHPLGIELAATWICELPCNEIVAELTTGLDLLETTLRDVNPQHRSLRAVFDASWRLLTEHEQIVLARLSIFRGGFSFDSAQQVAGASPTQLSQLRHKSLLRSMGTRRYDMHELIRQFAHEKLIDQRLCLSRKVPYHISKSRDGTELLWETICRDNTRQYCTYFHNFVCQQGEVLNGPNPQVGQAEIRIELDNIRAAWQVAIDDLVDDENLVNGQNSWGTTSIELIYRSTPGLMQFYLAAGLGSEGEERFQEAIAIIERRSPPTVDASHTLSTLLSIELYLAHARICAHVSKLKEGLGSAHHALVLSKSSGDILNQSRAATILGYLLEQDGQVSEAIPYLEEAVDLARRAGSPTQEAIALRYLGTTMMDGERRVEAEEYMEEALAINQTHQNLNEEQAVALYLGASALEAHDYPRGQRYLQLALGLIQRVGNLSLESRIQNAVGFVTALLGDLDEALTYHERARQISHQINEVVQESHTLHNLCTVERKRGNLVAAEAYGMDALRTAQTSNSPEAIAYAKLHLGYVWAEQERYAQAEAAFLDSHDLWRSIERESLAIEALVGLAHAALNSGDETKAALHVEEALNFLGTQTVDGVDEYFQIYLSLYAILSTFGDLRAYTALTDALAQLNTIASTIADSVERARFLHAIPANRALHELIQLHYPEGGSSKDDDKDSFPDLDVIRQMNGSSSWSSNIISDSALSN